MKSILVISVLIMVGLTVVGCKGDDASKPSTAAEVKEFKGDPTSPKLQEILKSHMQGGAGAQQAAANRK